MAITICRATFPSTKWNRGIIHIWHYVWRSFISYILRLSSYMYPTSRYPPHFLTTAPIENCKRTNNGLKSFHSHYNEQFHLHHSNTYVFINVNKNWNPGRYLCPNVNFWNVRLCSQFKERKRLTSLFASTTRKEIILPSPHVEQRTVVI